MPTRSPAPLVQVGIYHQRTCARLPLAATIICFDRQVPGVLTSFQQS